MTELIKDNVGIILQARMGSSRLPGKVLLPFGNTTLLGWIISRIKNLPWKLVVATSSETRDDAIAEYCAEQGVECFRGSEQDVLDRYYQCAKTFAFEHAVRLTADNPFPDTDELARLIRYHIEGRYDYSHNIGKLPVGVGAEIFSMKELETSWKDGQKPHHREHVNEYILEQSESFKIGYLEPLADRQSPALAFTIDTDADYQRIHACATKIEHTPITTEDLINQCTSSA
ncbi:MAG TPA: NTP transferase domain-containing protein [Methylophilaceae bacterium]|jgi:spore coat polysaccharide biosynthesis protein SpsF